MASGRLKGSKYLVHWRARVLLPDRTLKDSVIKQVCLDGVRIEFDYAVPLGTAINVEFYVTYKGENTRIRAKTEVVYCMVLSGNQGVVIELRLTYLSDQERHTLNNILQLLENSTEFDLRAP